MHCYSTHCKRRPFFPRKWKSLSNRHVSHCGRRHFLAIHAKSIHNCSHDRFCYWWGEDWLTDVEKLTWVKTCKKLLSICEHIHWAYSTHRLINKHGSVSARQAISWYVCEKKWENVLSDRANTTLQTIFNLSIVIPIHTFSLKRIYTWYMHWPLCNRWHSQNSISTKWDTR